MALDRNRDGPDLPEATPPPAPRPHLPHQHVSVKNFSYAPPQDPGATRKYLLLEGTLTLVKIHGAEKMVGINHDEPYLRKTDPTRPPSLMRLFQCSVALRAPGNRLLGESFSKGIRLMRHTFLNTEPQPLKNEWHCGLITY